MSKYSFQDTEPKAKVVGDFIIYFKQLLGQGKYGKVYAGIRKSDQMKVAVKVSANSVAFDEKNLNLIMQSREIVVMQKVKSENLIQFYDCQITQNNIYLFIELCNGDTLTNYLKNNPNLSDQRIIQIFQQICNGFKVLVKEGVIHRDLKPDNIMLHDDVIKISDFGFARFIEGDPEEAKDYTLKGTPLYVPPQVFDGKKYSNLFDVWSFGCILYEMMYGKHMHDNIAGIVQLKQKLMSLKNSKLQLPQSNRNVGLIDMLRRMLEYSEEDRITWPEIFKHDLCRLEPAEYLGILPSQFEILGQQPVISNSYTQIIQAKIHATVLFSQLLQDFEKANFAQFFQLKWINIILFFWHYFVDSVSKQIELKKRIPGFEQQQFDFSKSDQATLLKEYLKKLSKEVQNQLELNNLFMQQWVQRPAQMMIGRNQQSDEYLLYSFIEKRDMVSLVQIIEKHLYIGVFQKEMYLSLTSILRMVKIEMQLI